MRRARAVCVRPHNVGNAADMHLTKRWLWKNNNMSTILATPQLIAREAGLNVRRFSVCDLAGVFTQTRSVSSIFRMRKTLQKMCAGEPRDAIVCVTSWVWDHSIETLSDAEALLLLHQALVNAAACDGSSAHARARVHVFSNVTHASCTRVCAVCAVRVCLYD